MSYTEGVFVEPDALWSEVAGLLALPLLIIDLAGHLLASNPAGEALISASFALQVEAGRLVPRRQVDLLSLQAALLTLSIKPIGSLVCNLPSREGKPSLILHMRLLGGTPPRVLALVKDVTLPKPQEAAIVAANFGLSAAQARVVALLSSGLDTAEIAERLGLQRDAIRTHLKRAMAITGARTQAQLVLLVTRGLASG